jgi:hypothetical protein
MLSPAMGHGISLSSNRFSSMSEPSISEQDAGRTAARASVKGSLLFFLDSRAWRIAGYTVKRDLVRYQRHGLSVHAGTSNDTELEKLKKRLRV